MTKRCFYCDKEVTDTQFWAGLAVKTIHDLYAHTGCIDSHGKEKTMNDRAQDILSAADYTHQRIGLARSLLQESLGNTGQILTQGCMELGPASLGSTMRLGQKLKEFAFLLDDLLKDAHGLCILLGKDLGVCEDAIDVLADLDSGKMSPREYFAKFHPLDSNDPGPGEDEFDDDEQPF